MRAISVLNSCIITKDFSPHLFLLVTLKGSEAQCAI